MSNTPHYEYERLLKAHVRASDPELLRKAVCDFIDGASVSAVEAFGRHIGVPKPE